MKCDGEVSREETWTWNWNKNDNTSISTTRNRHVVMTECAIAYDSIITQHIHLAMDHPPNTRT